MKLIKQTTVYKDRTAIPSAIRRYFNINDGDSLMWGVDKDRIALYKTKEEGETQKSDVIYNLEKYGYELLTVENIFSLKDLNVEEIVVQVLANFPEPS